MKLFKKSDLILIAAILAAAALCFVLLRPGGAGETVVVTVEGRKYARLPLDRAGELLITNSAGETNRLVIENGAARVVSADCENQVCVNTGEISEAGELIVCLPHKVVVTIESGED